MFFKEVKKQGELPYDKNLNPLLLELVNKYKRTKKETASCFFFIKIVIMQ